MSRWDLLPLRSKETYSSIVNDLMQKYFTYFPRKRSNVMSEDWDNLLLLDACRYDVFKMRNTIPGDLEHRISKGSYTGGFFEGNFEGSSHHDTVYVTANPVPRVEEWCSVDIDTIFYDTVDVWKDHWDKNVNTVRPEPVAEAIRSVQAEYTDKRILGHFVQPHQPFIGDIGREIEERGMRAYDKLGEGTTDSGKQIWERLERGELSTDRVWKAYVENLDLVLPHVQDLCDDLTGKTVVSSDHGNLFGEFAWPFPVRKYGHPPGIHTKQLVKVPWLETDFETRKEITSEPPVQTDSQTDEKKRLERLRHLGYR